jgi:hypothetical protein
VIVFKLIVAGQLFINEYDRNAVENSELPGALKTSNLICLPIHLGLADRTNNQLSKLLVDIRAQIKQAGPLSPDHLMF